MVAQASVKGAALFQGRKIGALLIGSVIALGALSTAAQAQCVFTGIVPTNPGGANALGMTSTLPSNIAAAVATANTAFLAQTTAFISSPPGTQPSQLTGGVWIRGVGGYTDVDSRGTGTTSVTAAPITGRVNCNTTSKSDFAGVQGGIDLGSLNVGNTGWNLHVGVTAGYLESDNKTGAAKARFEIPFVGLYAALTGGGGFYVDAQIRKDFYHMRLSDPTISLGQNLDGEAWGITSSAGYVFGLGNFIVEPSVGVVYSQTSIDPLTFAAVTPGFLPIPGTLRIQDIETLLGRASLRVGTSMTLGAIALQPFAAASVWHEFADNINASYRSQCPPAPAPPCITFNGLRTQLAANSSSTRIGTFGQFSLGFAASIPDTPWLGYLRVDYRTGENIEGLTVNGGIRYQFAPGPAIAVRARS
jgi:outer membrane autotransporter protein